MDTGFATRVVQNKRHVLRVGIGGDAAPTAILSGMTMMTGLADFYGLRAHCFCYRIKKIPRPVVCRSEILGIRVSWKSMRRIDACLDKPRKSDMI